MKATIKKLPVMLTTIALAGQLTYPAAAASPLAPRAYEGNVIITEAFQDQKLQAWLLDSSHLMGAGSDGVLTEDERLAVTRLDLSGLGLTSLDGLGAFPNLQILNCSRNDLSVLDVSQNPKLTQLSCMSNQLTSLNLSANPELEHLNCNFNSIRTLDLSGHRNLKSLYCEMNQMEKLTISGCTELKTLYCRNNQLDQLLLTDNTKLEFIETFDNQLTTIDVSMLSELRFLHIDHNRLTHLDMSHNTKLEGSGFVARNNFMEQIKLPNQPGLMVDLEDYEEQDPMEGYDRAAWFLDPEFTTSAPERLAAAGQTLYSKRIANTYTIYFSANGGNSAPAGVPTQWGTQVQLPEHTPQRHGYTFVKWNTQPRGDGTTYEAGAQVTNLAGAKTDGDRITLYAQWAPNQYTIRLEPGDGEGQPKTQGAVYGQAVKLMDNPFTNGDKMFAGWATTPGGTVRYGNGAQVQSLTAEANGTVTLYAVWRASAAELQKEHLEHLDAAFQRYAQKDYTESDWNKLSGAYTAAIGQIQSSSDEDAMEKMVEQAKADMSSVPTAQARVEEVTGSWTTAHAAALGYMSANSLTESNAKELEELAQSALDDLAQEKLALRSSLDNEADRQQVVGQAAQQLQPQADGLIVLAQAAKWVENLDNLTLRPMEQVQEEDAADYQNAISRYQALDSAWKERISPSVFDQLDQRQKLAVEKRAETQDLQQKFDQLDKDAYTAQGQAALLSALNSGLAAIRAAGSVDGVQQAGTLAWNQITQVPTKDQEPTVPPTGGGGAGGGSSGGGGAGGDGAGETQKPTETPGITVTDEKTGATATVITGSNGNVTAQVTVPDGVVYATLHIPSTGGAGTVAVRVRNDGTRQVLPRSVYRDGALTVRVDGSCTLELVDGSKSFTDVTGRDWFADSVQFAASRELFSGVGGGRFAPADSMTRSMLVTVLHRLEGSPAPTADDRFQDVPADAWYSTAANWAAEQGITGGTSDRRFDPDAPITRESLAVMLYRAAGKPVVSGNALDGFQDGAQTSAWAREAMEWACASGILTGSGGNLRPQADITRAEVAAMLTRFVTNTTMA